MDIVTLTDFFKYCTIINLLVLLLGGMVMKSDLAFNMHSKLGFWSGTKEDHKTVVYTLFGNFKIFWLMFNLVPYIALCCFI